MPTQREADIDPRIIHPADVEESKCDADLLFKRSREGSESALGLLLESYRHYLLSVANAELAEDLRHKVAPSDIVQQTFLEAIKGFPFFRGNSSEEVQAWLRKVLLNNVAEATRHYRGAAMRDVSREVSLKTDDSSGNGAGAMAVEEPSPSGLATASEERERLRDAMQCLPDRYRAAIELRNLRLFTFEQVGAELGLSANAARKLWARAMVTLTKKFVHEGVGTTSDERGGGR